MQSPLERNNLLIPARNDTYLDLILQDFCVRGKLSAFVMPIMEKNMLLFIEIRAISTNRTHLCEIIYQISFLPYQKAGFYVILNK